MSAVLNESRRLNAAGLSTIPIRHDGSKAPALDSWDEYQQRLPTEKELATYHKNGCGLAIVCGTVSGNLEDIDIDEPALYEPWRALVETLAPGLLDRLPAVQTPSGGYAIPYRHDGPPDGSKKLACEKRWDASKGKDTAYTLIETRADGGYFIIPPSPAACHPDKKPYVMLRGDLARVPTITSAERAILLDAARSFNRVPEKEKAEPRLPGPTHGTRPGDDYNARAEWRDILERHGWALVYVRDGVGHWRRPGKAEGISATTGYAGSTVLYVFSTNADPFESDTSYTKFAAYTLLEHDGDYSQAARTLRLQGYGTAHNLTDTGNGCRLVEHHGHDVRYVAKQGCWYVWDGTRWADDDTGELMRRAKQTVGTIYDEAKYAGDKRETVGKWALKSESIGSLRAMIDAASSELAVAARVGDFDKDPWLFNCLNGTLDLRTRQLRPHRHDDLITKIAPVPYDAEAMCPRWLRFLDDVFAGDAATIGFVQRAIGSALTGDVRDHALFFLHGGGRNGKSTLLKTIMYTLGDYAQAAAPSLLLSKGYETHPTEIADLHGARFVATIEVEEGRHFAESLVKQLTGGDGLRARRMRENFWGFEPTHHIFLAANHRPVIKGTDTGIWSRIRLIPFNVSFLGREDHTLDAALKTEASGILAWAVRGCVEWQRSGLAAPATIEKATGAYRADSDQVGKWGDASCIFRPDARLGAQEAYRSYEAWCHVNAEPVGSMAWFKARLEERGLSQVRTKSGMVWVGIGPKPRESDS